MSAVSDPAPTGNRHNHDWDKHGACRNCSAIDFAQADTWRPPWRTPDTGELLIETPGWARVGTAS